MIPMIMSVLYVWAQLNKDTIVTFWFGTRFKVTYVFSPTVFTSHITVSHFKHEINICSVTPSHGIVSYFHTFFLLGTLFALGHLAVKLYHWRIVSNQFYSCTTPGISLDGSDSTNTHFFLVCRAYIASRDLWKFLIFQNWLLCKC